MTTSTSTSPAAPVISTGCCEPFDPKTWDDKDVRWRCKPFLRDRVVCLFHVPLDMGRKVARDMALIEASGAVAEHGVMLSDERSPWRSDIYIEVTRPVPGATVESMSGRFLTRVFEGPFRDMGKWVAEMQRHVVARGLMIEHLYFWYTTCPRCARAHGKNYVVLFAKVAEGRSFSRGIS